MSIETKIKALNKIYSAEAVAKYIEELIIVLNGIVQVFDRK